MIKSRGNVFMLGKNNKVRDLKANTVVHYKSYKVGKRWVFAGLAALSMGAGIFFGGLNFTAYADITSSQEVTQTSNVNETQPSNTASAKTSATPNTGNKGVSATSTVKAPTNGTQVAPSKPAENTQPATPDKSADSTNTAVTSAAKSVPTNDSTPTAAKTVSQAVDTTPDITNLGDANNNQIAAAKTAAEATYKATGKAQEITASLDNIAPSVQLGSTTLSTTGENDVSLNYGSATKAPTILVSGNANAGDTLKIDLPPVYQVQSFDTDFNGTKSADNSSVSYKFNQDAAYTLHIYTTNPYDSQVNMDTDGTTPMNLTVTKNGTATVYPLKVTSAPSLSTTVSVGNSFNGQYYTLNLADAVNGVIPNVTLDLSTGTNNNYLPSITSGSYSVDVPKGFVADTTSSGGSDVTITQPGGAGTPVTLTFTNASDSYLTLSGSINITDQTAGNENFAKNNTSGTLQNGTHSPLPVSISYEPLTYVNVAAISQPQNYVTSYAGNNTWPKFDNDTYHDIGLYSVVTGGQSATSTNDQVTFNVPDGVIATKITTPAYAANVTVTLKSGKKVQYNNINNSVITGTAADPIVSVTSKSIDKQTYPVDTKDHQTQYSNIESSTAHRFFVSGYLPNATVGDTYTVTTSNDDTDAPQNDTSTFKVADYGVIQYNGYGNRSSTSTADNGVRYTPNMPSNSIHDSYYFSNSQGESIVGPATATYYVVVPDNAILSSLDDIQVSTTGSQTAVKEVLPQTLNGQEIVKINVNNPEKTILPSITLNYTVSPTAKLGQTITLNDDSAGSGRFIMTGNFQPQNYAEPTSQTTTLKNFASLVGDTSSNVYTEDESATFMITSAAAFTGDVPAKTSKDGGYPEDAGKTSTTFMQKYNETGTLRVNTANTTDNDLKNVNTLVTLPTKADGNDFSVQVDGSQIANMTIPAGSTVLYSPQKVTDTANINTTTDGFVTANNVTDWSKIRSILVQSPSLTSLKQATVYVPIKVADYTPGQPSKPDTVTLNSTASDVKSEKPMNVQSKSTINLSIPKTTINVHYVNGNGTMLATTSTGTEAVGGTYNWTSPSVLGYHVSTGQPTSYTVTANDGETKNINVVYEPNDEPLTVNYVNQHGTVFTTTQQTGKFGQTVSIDQKTFDGYTAQTGNPTTYTFTKDGDGQNVVTLYYIAQNKAITIHYVYAGGGTAAPDVPESGIIGDTYSQTSPTIANFTPDQTSVAGTLATNSTDVTVTYTRDTAHADIIYVDDDNKGQVIPSTTQSETGGAGTTANFNLNVPANYAMVTPATSAAITFLNDNATNNTDDNVTIHLKHGIKTVTPSQPQVPGNPIPGTSVNWPAGTDSADLNRTVNETVQYVYTDGGKVAPDKTQSVNFQRAAAVDAVTGDLLGYMPVSQVVAYNADPTSVTLSQNDGWTVKSGNPDFAALTSPTGKPGYTPNIAATQTYTVDPSDGNLVLTVNYTPDKQQANVNYVDDDANGAQVRQDNLNGVTNGTQNYAKVLQAVKGGLTALGYQIVGTDLPANDLITFDNDDKDPQTYTVHLKHMTTVVTPNQPQTPGTKTPNRNLNWPNGVNKNDLIRTVNQTIQYVYSNGGKVAPDHQASVNFQRVAVVDQVTGKLLGYLTPDKVAAYKADPTSTPLSTDGGWASATPTANFAAVNSPAGKTGYTPNVAKTTAYDVTPTTGSSKLTVTYTPDPQKTMVTYVDDDNNGATVHQDTVTGVTDGTNNYAPVKQAIEGGLTAQGYTIVSDNLPVKGIITFGNQPGATPSYTVHVKHQTQTFTPDQPDKPNQPIFSNNPNGPKWPAGADSDNLTKTITETVKYVYANNNQTAAPDKTDSVVFTRNGTVDLVTQKITYTTWAAKNKKTSFSAQPSPVITGYLADVAEVPEIDNITPTTANVNKTVTYSPVGEYTTNLTNVPGMPYPNDPKNANQITTTAIPYEPGYQPYGPDGTPLKPVDPNDLTKGYLPPIPKHPLDNTPITYIPNTVPSGGTNNTPTVPAAPNSETQTSGTHVPATGKHISTPVITSPSAKTKVPVATASSSRQSSQPVSAKASKTVMASTASQSSVNGETTPNGVATNDATNVNKTISENGTVKVGASATEKSSQATQKLPQTNEQSTSWLSLLGLSLLGFLGLGKIRRRKND